MNERNEYRLHAIYPFIQHTINSTNKTSEKEREMLFQNTFNKPSNRDINETCKIKGTKVHCSVNSYNIICNK